jgi:hypothetical protein
VCRRCRADLSLLVALEKERTRFVAAAKLAIACGQGQEALLQAEAAERLRSGDDTDRLVALGHLVRRDFSAAWIKYKNMQIRQKLRPPIIDQA